MQAVPASWSLQWFSTAKFECLTCARSNLVRIRAACQAVQAGVAAFLISPAFHASAYIYERSHCKCCTLLPQSVSAAINCLNLLHVPNGSFTQVEPAGEGKLEVHFCSNVVFHFSLLSPVTDFDTVALLLSPGSANQDSNNKNWNGLLQILPCVKCMTIPRHATDEVNKMSLLTCKYCLFKLHALVIRTVTF